MNTFTLVAFTLLSSLFMSVLSVVLSPFRLSPPLLSRQMFLAEPPTFTKYPLGALMSSVSELSTKIVWLDAVGVVPM